MPEERKKVGSFKWPFIRYDVLMPAQVKTDLFEWLYLSLVVHQNDLRSIKRNSYIQEVKNDVRRIIKQRFASLLDDATIDNVIAMAEKEFTVTTEQYGDIILIEETFGFLDTYEDLFTSQVSVQKMFQDAICNGVVPCFKDNEYIKENRDEIQPVIKAIVKDKPTQNQIKKAYMLYNKLNSADTFQEDILEEDEFYDENAEVDFDPLPQAEEDFLIKKGPVGTNFSTYFIDNSECLFDLEIDVYCDGKSLYINTPFDPDITERWFDKRLIKARSVSEELDKYLSDLESQYIENSENVTDNVTYVNYKGVADQLTYCGEIYRMIEHLPIQYNDLKNLLIEIDKSFTSEYVSYFNTLGKYLECLILPFADRSDADVRSSLDYTLYCSTLKDMGRRLNVNLRPLLSENIHKNWQKAWDYFKADLSGLFISNVKMRRNHKLYYDFVKDAFDLYDSRNNGSHYKQSMSYNYDSADIEKLAKVTRVFVELI